MSQQIINLGTADKGNGDVLRTAFTKVNENFAELYNSVSAVVVASATAPAGPGAGDLWWNSEDGRMYIYYGTAWVDASPVDGAGISSTNELVNGAHTVSLSSAGLTAFPAISNESLFIQASELGSANASIGISAKNSVIVTANILDTAKQWTFGTEGKLTLPAGTTYEYLNAPLTGHGDGLARLDFTLATDGVGANWIAASASPAGSGYSPGDTFTFDAEFLGIPGASVTIEVLTVGPGGSVEDLSFSEPPLYPADIYRDSPINLQVGPESNRWTFGHTGKLTTPGDIQLGADSYLRFPDSSFQGTAFVGDASRLYGNVDEDVEVTVRHRPAVSAQHWRGGGVNNFVADTSDNDDITVVQEGWTVDIDGTVYTVTAIIPGINEFEIYATGATFVVGTTYTFTNPTATLHTWTFNQQTATLIAPGGAILSSETAPILGGDTYRDFSIDLPTPDGTNEYRWTFDNTAGDLTVPGAIKQGNNQLDLNYSGGGFINLTSTADDSTSLYLSTDNAALVGKLTASVTAGEAGQGARTTYLQKIDQLAMAFVNAAWTGAGYPASPTSAQALAIAKATNPLIPDAWITIANELTAAYDAWQEVLTFGDFSIAVGGNDVVWQFKPDAALTLPTQSTPILTVNNVAPTPKIYRATSSNDAVAINAAQASWYDAELTYIDIRDQDEIVNEYTYPWSGLPSWEAQGLLADWNVNRPDGAPNPNSALGPAITTAVNNYLNWKELESNIDIVSGNKTFRFGNNGNLSLPGEITFTNTTNAKIVVGANPSPYEGTPTPVSTWTFGVGDGNGSITFPNGSVQTTAYTSTPFDKLVNGSKEVVLGSDGVLTIPQQGKLSVAGITAVNLASLETAYNDAETLYTAERTTWMTVNSHTPRWYLLSGLVAYSEILDGAYTEPDWTGTATLTSRALAATTAYNTWQTAIANSELTVKSDASAWTFNSENKLTLSQGGIISGGDPVAIAAANNARAAEQSDWYYVITTAGADENIRPWHFAGASKDERLAVTTAMWQAQQTLDPGDTLGWTPISAALYNEVRSWIALNSSSDDYTEWKKLTTSVNITSEDKTWSFTNDGRLTVPGAVAALVDEDLALVTSYTPLTSPPGLNPPVDNFFVFGANGELTLPGGITKGLDEDFVISTSFTAMVSPPGPVSTAFTFGANGTLTIPDQILGTTNLTLRCAAGQTTSIEAGVGGSIEIGYQPSPPANIYIGTATAGYTTTTNIQSDRLRVLVDAPTTSKGQSGDVMGLVAFSSTHIYYCTAEYTDGLSDIWKRVELTGSTW